MNNPNHINVKAIWEYYIGKKSSQNIDSCIMDCLYAIRGFYSSFEQKMYASDEAISFVHNRILGRKMGIAIVTYLGEENEC